MACQFNNTRDKQKAANTFFGSNILRASLPASRSDILKLARQHAARTLSAQLNPAHECQEQPAACSSPRKSAGALLGTVPLNCFRDRYNAEEAENSNAFLRVTNRLFPRAVGEEEAAEIATDHMRVFCGIRGGTMGTQEFRTWPVPIFSGLEADRKGVPRKYRQSRNVRAEGSRRER